MAKKIKLDRPDITIIIPCYNIEKYIDECLDSVMTQSHISQCEVICINDASTDSTKQRLEKYAKRNRHIIHVINNRNNKGVSESRNRGLDIANGKNIMFIDGDDIIGGKLDSNKVDTHYLQMFSEEMQANPDAAMIRGEIVTANSELEIQRTKMCENMLFRSGRIVKNPGTALSLLDQRISCCAALYRTDLIQQYALRFTPGLMYYEDARFTTTYALNSIQSYKYIFANAPKFSFYVYRCRPDSAMTKLARHSESNIRTLERTKNKLEYYASLLKHCETVLGADNNFFNIAAHRRAKTAKQISRYKRMSALVEYDILSDAIPKDCVECDKTNCAACINYSMLKFSIDYYLTYLTKRKRR